MYGFCILLIGKGIDGNLVGYHECGIETKSEMTYDLVIVCFILVFFNEIGSAGKCDLVDVLFHFVCGHSETVIGEGHRLLLGTYDYVDACFVIKRCFVLAHHFKFFQFRDGVASVGN